jgi:glycosyltransferase involved in cell wall biosynthesis
MDWRPNQDAVRYFVSEIFPRLKREVKEARFYIVGREPAPAIRSMATDDIIVTGTVPDVRPYLRKAALVVAPLRIGGGSRLKILEAMAMRKPVVSTKVGAEGLCVTAGKNILIAESSDEFVRNCLKALTDMPYSAMLADSGYDLVNSRYRWETIAEKMAHFLRVI